MAASNRVDAAVLARYRAEIAPQDPYLRTTVKRAGRFEPDWAKLDQDALEATPFVRDWLDSPQVDLRWTAGAALPLADGDHAMLATARPRRAGPYQDAELEPVRLIAQAVLRAVDAHRHVGARKGDPISILSAAHPGEGVVLLGADGRCLGANAEAEAILASAEGARLERGALRCAAADDQAALKAALSADAGALHDGPARPLVLFCRGSDGFPRLRLRIVPLRPSWGRPGAPKGAVAAVVIEDLSLPRPPRLEALAALSLTAAERELGALLLDGLTLAEAAEMRKTRYETARTQLKSLMSKLQVARQADLVRYLMRLAR